MNQRITGIYRQDRPDFGRVITDSGESYFVGHYNRSGALPGDFVDAMITRSAKENLSAEVRVGRIFSRTNEVLYGTITKSRKNPALSVLLDIPEGERIRIRFGKDLKARMNDAVGVRVTGFGKWALAEVVEVLGKADNFQVEREICIKKSGIPIAFRSEVLEAAETLSSHKDGVPNRVDCTDHTIITIDGADAKDLDDAIGVEILPNGNFELTVHIADVAEYVEEGWILDQEALRRGTSVYLSDRVIPMLPEKLSNDLCSLHPGSVKLCLAIAMEIDATNGKVLNSRIFESSIFTSARTTYDQVESWHLRDGEYPTPSEEVLKLVDRAYNLVAIVDKRRESEGKIELEVEETKVQLDANGEPIAIVTRERKASHRLIETCMILANEEISRYFAKNKIPFLYRVHEPPSDTDEAEIRTIFANYSIVISPGILTPKKFRDAYAMLLALDEVPPIEKTLLSKLSKAIYSDEALGHYGLALQYYSHFTSPIRRYPDLQIHRIIKRFLRKTLDIKHFAQILKTVAKSTSDSEKIAESLERSIRDFEIARFLEKKVGTLYDGVVTGTSKYAYYVRIDDGIEGAVFLGKPKEWETHTFPAFGTKVRVKLVSVDRLYRRIDFKIVSDV